MFFESGSPTPSKQGREILALIVGELNKIPNRVALEGHTDSKPFRGASSYSNWELSVDRANGARRIMVENSFSAERIAEVRGFADRQLRDPGQPENPSNRRISLIVMYADQPEEAAEMQTSEAGHPGAHPTAANQDAQAAADHAEAAGPAAH
jgi:chemotaxis protein MotB